MKKIYRRKGSLLLYIILASCQQPVIDDKIIETEIVTTAIIIEEKIMELKPIPEYGAYVFTENKRLFGLESSFHEILPERSVGPGTLVFGCRRLDKGRARIRLLKQSIKQLTR